MGEARGSNYCIIEYGNTSFTAPATYHKAAVRRLPIQINPKRVPGPRDLMDWIRLVRTAGAWHQRRSCGGDRTSLRCQEHLGGAGRGWWSRASCAADRVEQGKLDDDGGGGGCRGVSLT